MADRIVETRTVTNEDAAHTTQAVSEPTSFTAARIVWFIAGIIITLLALRFLFVLLGANQGNGFVSLIYTLSYPFAAPFFGIFSDRTTYGIARLETSTLVGIAIYSLIAWGIARLVTIRHPHTPAA